MQCGNDGEHGYCVEACDLTAQQCPGGFVCQDVGNGTGVCWPSQEGGGCLAAGRSSNGAFLLAIGLAALLITRKRRR